MTELLLASRSPRRRELLGQLGIAFEVLPVDIEEIPLPSESALEYNRRVAREKALAGAAAAGGRKLAVLGADTEVIDQERVFGKPADREEAAAMLQDLSGRTHQVATALALVTPDGRVLQRQQTSKVTFARLQQAAIDAYCASDEPLGKAGAYAIQGRAGAWISHLSGSYSGVMGLPLYDTVCLLSQAGIAMDPALAVSGKMPE